MDILSDVNVVGNLNVSKAVDSFNLTTKTLDVLLGVKVKGFSTFNSSSTFNSCATFNGDFISKGIALFEAPPKIWKCMDGKGYYSSPDLVSIDVPANCQRFIIKKNFISSSTSNLDGINLDDILYYPSITAWCGRKKVEVDLEICADPNEINTQNGISEFIIGSVTPSTSDRTIKFSIALTA